MCAGRESNSGLVRGRDVYYHCTTGADVVVCQWALHSASPGHWGHKRCGARAQTGRGQEAMAQWQRVGFQTQRLGVRIPLASHPFFGPFFCNRQSKPKKSALPKLGIAPRLPRPQRGVLLLDYFGSRRALEDPGIDPGSQPCEGCMLPCTTIPHTDCVHRDSNPNLILGRDKYYPCTMDACYLSASRNHFLQS